MRSQLLPVALLAAAVLAAPSQTNAEEIPKEYRDTVNKGLEYLARTQLKDGKWEGANGEYVIPCTALAGMAFLCEGSTLREGKYRDNLKRAVNFLIDKAQPNGLLANPQMRGEAGRYMYGHGFALMFLACVVGEEHSPDMRKKLMGVVERGCKFSRDAQTNRGGWGYVSAKDGSNFDEGSVTITQIQGLRAARNAGVIVPNEAIKMAQQYLKDSTNGSGGVTYSLAGGFGGGGDGRPALTAAAICCGFGFGDYKSDLVKRWLKFCQAHLRIGGGRMGHDEYTHYYYCQVVYVLGDDRFQKLFPEAKSDELLKWSAYRKEMFDHMKQTQSQDGSWSTGNWTSGTAGPVFVSGMFLTMLQLDKAALPMYQR